MVWFADRGRILKERRQRQTPSRCDTMATAVCGCAKRTAPGSFRGHMKNRKRSGTVAATGDSALGSWARTRPQRGRVATARQGDQAAKAG